MINTCKNDGRQDDVMDFNNYEQQPTYRPFSPRKKEEHVGKDN